MSGRRTVRYAVKVARLRCWKKRKAFYNWMDMGSKFARLEREQTFDSVNLTDQFLCSRESIRESLRRGLSLKFPAPLERQSSYPQCMRLYNRQVMPIIQPRGGVMLLMKSMAQELAPQKIRVNSICSGAVNTPINGSACSTPESEANLLTLIPYNRVGDPDDIGRAPVWLASDDSEYVNGASLFIDGGMTLYPGFATGG